MRMPSLNTQILAGTVAGILLGLGLAAAGPDAAITRHSLTVAGLAGTLFIDLLKMLLVPLVFTSIVTGVASLGTHDRKQMRRVGWMTIVFFVFSMAVAIFLGLSAANLFRPGADLNLHLFQDSMQHFQAGQTATSGFLAPFLHTLFQNPFAALAQGNILAIVEFALLLGIAMALHGQQGSGSLLLLFREGMELMLVITGWVMRLAPLGIMALLTQLMATQDMSLLGTLAKFVLVVAGTTLLHGVVVLPLILYSVTGMTPVRFWQGAHKALVTAFATSSSAATLPVTLQCVQDNLHVRKDIAGFVVPLGATLNMDGTALYEAAAALFIANLAGIELGMAQQIIVFVTAMIAAMGAPGIPSAGMVTMVMVLQSVGLPVEAIAILLPVDRLLDTFRTTVNVEGDMVACLVVQKMTDRPLS